MTKLDWTIRPEQVVYIDSLAEDAPFHRTTAITAGRSVVRYASGKDRDEFLRHVVVYLQEAMRPLPAGVVPDWTRAKFYLERQPTGRGDRQSFDGVGVVPMVRQGS